MADQEQQRKDKFLRTQEHFRENALKILRKMYNWAEETPQYSHLLDEILHSILFLGKMLPVRLSPEEIICDKDLLAKLKRNYPRPFKFYCKELPRRNPFSCVLDMIVLKKGQENEEDIKRSLQNLIQDLKGDILASSTICISQKSKAEQNSARCYGVSIAKIGLKGLKKILIAASCLKNWDKYVSAAVMTYCPHNKKKEYFDGTIKVPEKIRCETFSLNNDDKKMQPCTACHTLFGLNTTETTEWPFGNCAEAESLSNLLKTEEEVKEEVKKEGETSTDKQGNTAENRKKAENQVLEDLKCLLKTTQQETWKKWDNTFYIPNDKL